MSQPSSSSSCTPLLPTLLCAASLVIFFGWQVSNARDTKAGLEARLKGIEPAAQKASQQQAGLLNLASQLAQLAPNDKAAQAIVQKYRISLKNPDSPARSPKEEKEEKTTEDAEE